MQRVFEGYFLRTSFFDQRVGLTFLKCERPLESDFWIFFENKCLSPSQNIDCHHRSLVDILSPSGPEVLEEFLFGWKSEVLTFFDFLGVHSK